MPHPLCPPGWLCPDETFGAPTGGAHPGARPHALMTARAGGLSTGPYADCNLGDHVGDAPEAVAANRGRVATLIGATPAWMRQVHGAGLIRLTREPGLARPYHARHPIMAPAAAEGLGDQVRLVDPRLPGDLPEADGAFTTERGLACAVMVADCLPVLLAAPDGRGVAALHAGWRGLAGMPQRNEGGAGPGMGAGVSGRHGIVDAGVQALCEAASCDPADLQAWLGPCIGPEHFEVGADVLAAFDLAPRPAEAFTRFQPRGPAHQGKWLADLPGLARDKLHALGVRRIDGGTWCTVSAPSRFFSFRRDGVTGRQAALIWLA